MIPYSILDLAPVSLGSTPTQSFANSLDLAQHAEKWGYNRYWLAEHHNMPGIASAATSVVIGHIAAGTKTIRVGSGGVMLPNHAPLVIAEQFGTLASLFPGRIDLGLGRAPGTDQRTMRALRRNNTDENEFPLDALELQQYFEPASPGQLIQAVPGAGLSVPIWLLGSSLFSAQLAAQMGLPFAFASHFAPDLLTEALAIYRNDFNPSSTLDKPYAIAGINVFAADDDEQARFIATSHQQQFLNLRRGTPGLLPAPHKNMDELWNDLEKSMVERTLKYSFVGSAATIQPALRQFIETVRPDEIIVSGQIFDHQARLRSFEILADVLSY